jgi:hypothetical protein
MLLALPLAIACGTLTTLAGAGGGLLLVIVLSLLVPPVMALAASALALLVANGHRAWMFRREIDRRAAGLLALGVFPGAVVGGLVAVQVPAIVLRVAIVGVLGFAALRLVAGVTPRLPREILVPAGLVVGFLTATSGGAGLLVAPLLLAAGVEDDRYVATTAVAAVTMHIGRVAGYGLGGGIDREVVALAAGLAAALVVGNLLGRRLRDRIAGPRRRQLEQGTIAVCAALALVGL